MNLYPFQFEPIFRRYVWGGRRLSSVLEKPIGDGNDYAESWEIVDHGSDQSIVANGSLRGCSLADLGRRFGDQIFGRSGGFDQFPLLFKFLDANRDLSVQVHPNDEQAARLDPPDAGKTEAWYIIDADPGAKIYAGLQTGVGRSDLQAATRNGTVEACLNSFQPSPGDCVFIPAGVVHAIGQGLLVAEIQQSSDTTFRLFDWNRVGLDGSPRELHIEEALSVTDYDYGPVTPQIPKETDDGLRTNLVTCDKFVLDRIDTQHDFNIGGDDRFHVLVNIQGDASIGNPTNMHLSFGTTVLLPASCGRTWIQPKERIVMLDAYVP